MFWRKTKPYAKLMDAYRKEGYLAWKIHDSEYFQFGVTLKEHDDGVKIMKDGNRLREITNKAAKDIGIEAIVEGPFFLAGGTYGICVGVKKS